MHQGMSAKSEQNCAEPSESLQGSNHSGSFFGNKKMDKTMNMSQSNLNGEFSNQSNFDESFFKCFSHKTIWEQVIGLCTIALSATTLGVLLSIFLWF